MSERYALDASALLCMLLQERGSDVVEALLERAFVSAVNYSEMLAKLRDKGMPEGKIADIINEFSIDVVEFSVVDAVNAAALRNPTRKFGLSFGDRACLALAAASGATAVTTDQAWRNLTDIAKIKLVRLHGDADGPAP